MKNLAVKIGLGWVAYESIKLFLSFILSPIIGLIISITIDRDATDTESMANTISLFNTSSTVLTYVISFIAFFCVFYFIISKVETRRNDT